MDPHVERVDPHQHVRDTCESGHELERMAAALVADGKGILAADETPSTLTKRFDSLGIPSTEESRRTYREMLFIK